MCCYFSCVPNLDLNWNRHRSSIETKGMSVLKPSPYLLFCLWIDFKSATIQSNSAVIISKPSNGFDVYANLYGLMQFNRDWHQSTFDHLLWATKFFNKQTTPCHFVTREIEIDSKDVIEVYTILYSFV